MAAESIGNVGTLESFCVLRADKWNIRLYNLLTVDLMDNICAYILVISLQDHPANRIRGSNLEPLVIETYICMPHTLHILYNRYSDERLHTHRINYR